MKSKKKLNNLKIMRAASMIAAAVGFFAMLGVAGSFDYVGADIFSTATGLAVSVFIFGSGFVSAMHFDNEINELITTLVKNRAENKNSNCEKKQHNIA